MSCIDYRYLFIFLQKVSRALSRSNTLKKRDLKVLKVTTGYKTQPNVRGDLLFWLSERVPFKNSISAPHNEKHNS